MDAEIDFVRLAGDLLEAQRDAVTRVRRTGKPSRPGARYVVGRFPGVVTARPGRRVSLLLLLRVCTNLPVFVQLVSLWRWIKLCQDTDGCQGDPGRHRQWRGSRPLGMELEPSLVLLWLPSRRSCHALIVGRDRL